MFLFKYDFNDLEKIFQFSLNQIEPIWDSSTTFLRFYLDGHLLWNI